MVDLPTIFNAISAFAALLFIYDFVSGRVSSRLLKKI
jgi:hypothetical protein